jgi:hypothetical protein
VIRATLLAAVTLLVTACGGGGPDAAGPSPLSSRLTEGEAHVVVTGDMETEFSAPLDPDAPNLFQPPDGGFAVNWADESARGFGVGGPLFTGSRRTSERLSVSVTVVTAEVPKVFASFGGECRVTITSVGTEVLAGTFECRNLSKGSETIDAEGEFMARGSA